MYYALFMIRGDVNLFTYSLIDMKSCMVLLHTYSEGRVSQISFLGLSFNFYVI